MSRSRKKSGWVKDPASSFQKRRANKRVRRTNDIESGNSYKKIFDSWNISDWKCEARTIGEDPGAYQDWIK